MAVILTAQTKENITTMICENCEQNFDGNFCSNCGQNSNVKRVDLKYLINEIPNSIFQINRGFLFTVKELFTRPGYSIREFLNGKRKNHFQPIAFIFFTSTIYVLLNYLIGNDTFMDDFIAGLESSKGTNNTNFNWLSKNTTYMVLALIPFFSLASYLVFFKSRYNYFEHLVLNLYVTGQQMLIYLVFSFINTRDSSLILIPIVLGMLFNIWAYSQFFDNKTILKRIILITLTYLIFIFQILIGMIIIVGILKLMK
ncbi:DUF3667 domain-containing protein [Cryomorpha ignava]|uniref:DUF3667 domain-containing protein n=1 Tax=Cryomorpha ignava TaxID=101383 RepID=A0A7K3WTK5_9FLAO|nr:DUF3667 domain-containing protein [Cryomorpha ignava]NEN25010.1 DUF3667 domain-containing protein [Cryomorpha ignava]